MRRLSYLWMTLFLLAGWAGGVATFVAFIDSHLQFGDYQVVFPKALSLGLLATAMLALQRVAHYSSQGK